MEDEKDFDRLERLEGSVERLLAGYNNLQQDKGVLEKLLESKTAEISDLQEMIAELKGEKSSVHQRVSGLLSAIEEWEESQVSAAEVDDSSMVKEDDFASGGIDAAQDDPQLSVMSINR